MIRVKKQRGNNELDPDFRMLIKKLDNLKDDYRDVIILKDVSGYSMKEIAGIMRKAIMMKEKTGNTYDSFDFGYFISCTLGVYRYAG